MLFFEATVEEVLGFESLPVPFNVEVDSLIRGKYVFADESQLLQLLTGGFGSGTLTIEANGSSLIYQVNFADVNSGSPIVIGSPPADPMSSIQLAYLPLNEGNHGSLPSDAKMLLLGTDGTIQIPEDILNFDKWNQLENSRILELRFGSNGSIQASVGPIQIVPEPSGVVLISVTVIMLMNRGAFSTSQARTIVAYANTECLLCTNGS